MLKEWLMRWLKSYQLNRKALVDDARLAGKALWAIAFALRVYPGDARQPVYLVVAFLTVGLCLYVYGLRRVES